MFQFIIVEIQLDETSYMQKDYTHYSDTTSNTNCNLWYLCYSQLSSSPTHWALFNCGVYNPLRCPALCVFNPCNIFLAANIVKRPLVDRLPLSALYNVCPWLSQKKATLTNQQWRGRRSFVITCLIAIHFPLFHTIKTAPRGKTTPPKMETSHVSSEERFCLFQSIPCSWNVAFAHFTQFTKAMALARTLGWLVGRRNSENQGRRRTCLDA